MINRSYLSRRSCRNFDTSKPIPKEYIDEIKTVINLSPTSTNSQGFSAIFVSDYIIIFCADFNRSVYAQEKNKQEVTIDGMSQFTINMVDVALAAAAASIHANTLGLGACFLGGLRSNADQLVKPLNIEGKCLPVLGLAIG